MTIGSTASMITGIQKEIQTGIDKLKPRLETAKAGVTFIESDYSEGVHNPTFARYLLTRSDNLLTDFAAKYK